MKRVLVVRGKNINIAMGKFNKIVQVAVGILITPSLEVLMTQRALSLHQGGLWEFPGGKIEQGENAEETLKRELHEELSIKVQSIKPFISVEHYYSDKHVLLDTYIVTDYSGTAKICDGQLDLQWVPLQSWNPEKYPLPAANLEIMQKLMETYELDIESLCN